MKFSIEEAIRIMREEGEDAVYAYYDKFPEDEVWPQMIWHYARKAVDPNYRRPEIGERLYCAPSRDAIEDPALERDEVLVGG